MDELDAALLRNCNAMHGAPTATSRPSGYAKHGIGAHPLRDRGIIRGATLDLNLGAIGPPVQALIAVRIRPPSREIIEAFRDWVSALPETLGVFVGSGNEDFLIHIGVADTDGLSFVIDRLTQRREVVDVRTSVVWEHLRTKVIEPLIDQAGSRHNNTARRDRQGAQR